MKKLIYSLLVVPYLVCSVEVTDKEVIELLNVKPVQEDTALATPNNITASKEKIKALGFSKIGNFKTVSIKLNEHMPIDLREGELITEQIKIKTISNRYITISINDSKEKNIYYENFVNLKYKNIN